MCAVTFHRDSIARWLTREVTGCRKDKCVLHRITNFRLKRRLRRGKIKSFKERRLSEYRTTVSTWQLKTCMLLSPPPPPHAENKAIFT